MTITTFTDAELLAQARKGDETAFAELYVRHEAAARRLANAYARAGDPDDLVNGAFERVLKALRKGLGPTEAFRAYLFVTLRRLAADQIARAQDEPYDEVPEPVRVAAHEPGLDAGERTLVVRAFESLPDRWQAVLWHTAVEGRAPRDLAAPLGMSANAAAALAYRAREKLRQAYLQAHLQTTPRPQCEPHRSRLGAYVRDGLGTRDRGATEAHIDDCGSCRGLVAELADVNRLLVRSLVPIFARAGEVAALAAASTAVAAAAAAGAASGAGVGSALRGAGELGRRTWSKARSNPAATSAVVGALLVVAVVAGALIASRDDVALPGTPDEQATPAAPAPPRGADPASPEVPMEAVPPRLADPIVSSDANPPGTEAPTADGPGPTRPAAPRAPTAPTTRIAPHTPATDPIPSAPPTTRPAAPPSPAPPGIEPPPTTTSPPPPPPAAPPAPPPPADDDEPCLLYVRIGGLLRARLCIDLPLLGGAGGPGLSSGDAG